MNAKNLGKQAREQFKAGDKSAARESIRLMNAATTRKRDAQRTGKLGLSR